MPSATCPDFYEYAPPPTGDDPNQHCSERLLKGEDPTEGRLQREPILPFDGAPPPGLSQLDPLESNRQIDPTCGFDQWTDLEHGYHQPPTELEATFRHSGWAAQRQRVFDALKKAHFSRSTLEAFACCGSGLIVQRTADNKEIRLSANCCHNRWCVPCARAKAAIVQLNLKGKLDPAHTRFITLTLRHSLTPLSDQIDRLYRSFSALRHRVFWQGHVNGGAAFLETKLSDRDGLWHVHLHIVATGRFMDARHLSREWHAVTGDSSIVDIRAIQTQDDVAKYITKYLTKGTDAQTMRNPDAFAELIFAFRGRHVMLTFSSWRKLQLTKMPEDPRQWVNVGSVASLYARAREGDAEAIRWLEAARRRYGSLPPIPAVTEPLYPSP